MQHGAGQTVGADGGEAVLNEGDDAFKSVQVHSEHLREAAHDVLQLVVGEPDAVGEEAQALLDGGHVRRLPQHGASPVALRGPAEGAANDGVREVGLDGAFDGR